jgi:GNAT superfamily N-acetyltransferase
MEIQALTHADLKFLPDLQPADWPDITPHHKLYLQSSFCFPIKVVMQNEPVGVGVTIIHNDVAWLAHIIVHPEYRNKGLGQLITQTLVEKAKAENCETIYLIATELGAPVYRKIGFVTETEYLGFKDGKIEPGWIQNNNVVPLKEKHKQQVFDMDRIATGENRTFRLESYLEGAFVYEVNDRVEGYYLPAFGEGLVIANNAMAGLQLTKFRLENNNNVRCPIDNVAAVQFFRQNNYKEYLNQKRMRLGKERVWQPANLYSRTGGQIG